MVYDKRRNLIPFERAHPTRFPRVERWLETTSLSIGELMTASRAIDPRGEGLHRRTIYRMRIGMPNLRTAYLMVALSQRYPGVGDGGERVVLRLWDWDVEGYRDGETGDQAAGTGGSESGATS